MKNDKLIFGNPKKVTKKYDKNSQNLLTFAKKYDILLYVICTFA